MDKPFFIVNPVSANGRTAHNWIDIQNKLKVREMDYDFYVTQAPMEATLETRRALDKGYTTIVAVGGDGTLNEVVNGFFRHGEYINPHAHLGIISSGTGSDFVRTFGITHDFNLGLDAIRRNETRLIDIGHVAYTTQYRTRDERYFINVAGFGIDGEIVDRVNRSSKRWGGFASFLMSTIFGILTFQNKKVALTLDDNLIYVGGIICAVAANGRYIGSGMNIAPNAICDDGLFDVIIVEDMSKIGLLFALPGLYHGTHLTNSHCRSYRGKHLVANTVENVLLDVDGEQPGFLDAEFSILPRAIHLIR